MDAALARSPHARAVFDALASSLGGAEADLWTDEMVRAWGLEQSTRLERSRPDVAALDQPTPLGEEAAAVQRFAAAHQRAADLERQHLLARVDAQGVLSTAPAARGKRRTPDQALREALLKECRKQRNVMPMRTLVRKYAPAGLLDIMPVWLVSPETLAVLFPREPLFDLVVFDEASQVTVENGLPALLRAERVVVSGARRAASLRVLLQPRLGNGTRTDGRMQAVPIRSGDRLVLPVVSLAAVACGRERGRREHRLARRSCIQRVHRLTLLVACFVAAPASAQVQSGARTAASLADALTGEAKREYEAARLLVADDDFASAAVKFRRAWELSRDPRLLWNMGVCEKHLRHYARALELLERYRSEGRAVLSAVDRKEADDAVRALRAYASSMTVTSDVAGAEVYVDDERVGTTPLEALVLVDLGRHRVRVVRAGYRDYTTTIDASGAKVVIDARLAADSGSSTPAPSAAAGSPASTGYAIGAIGFAGLAFGTYGLVHAHGLKSDSDDAYRASDADTGHSL